MNDTPKTYLRVTLYDEDSRMGAIVYPSDDTSGVLGHIQALLEDPTGTERLSIEACKMTPVEYDGLGEFEGF